MRVVFSSSGDLDRATRVDSRERSPFRSFLGAAAEGLFATLFPADCRFCGAPLLNISRLPVCPSCLAEIEPIRHPVCATCGERLDSPYALSETDGEPRCGECQALEPPFAKAMAYGSYDAGLRELIHLLKYDHVRPAANVLGRMLAEVMEALCRAAVSAAPAGSDALARMLVVPVPLHAAKLRQRGFNQSELLVWAALKQKRVPAGLRLNSRAIVRTRATESQTGLTPQQRRENVRGAFEVVSRADVAGRDVLLVDDVYTTGTTVSECARVLRRAGAERVWVATVARVLKPELAAAVPPQEDEEEARVMAAHA